MKDFKEKVKIVEEEFDEFRTFINMWNIRNAYFRNSNKLIEIDGKMFDNDGKLVFDKIISFEYVVSYIDDFQKNEPNKYRIYNNMRISYIRKRSRVFDRNSYILENYKFVYFVTLTFNDYGINLCFRTRRKWIYRYLSHFPVYICNIDYGDSDEYIDNKGNLRIGTHREHYHCLIGLNDPNKCYFLYEWNLGFSYIEKCKVSEDDKVRLSKYIIKLTNHNIKLSTKGNNIIYSKTLKGV